MRYLQTNKIAVYATLVGDSARWGEEWLDRFHVPFTGVYDNILYKYTASTGGDYYAEGNVNGIERSYAKIADEARDQYTLGYLSHEFDLRRQLPQHRCARRPAQRHGDGKRGYWPSGQDYK